MSNLDKIIYIILTRYQDTPFSSKGVLECVMKDYPEWVNNKVIKGKNNEEAEQQVFMEVCGYLSRLLNRSGKYRSVEDKLIDKGYSLDKIGEEFSLISVEENETIAFEEDDSYNRDEILVKMRAGLSDVDSYKVSVIYEVARNINSIMGWVGKSHQLKLEIDHAISLKEGGSHHQTNLQLLTQRHNASKGVTSSERMTVLEQKTYILNKIMVESFLPDFNMRLIKVEVELSKLDKVFS